MCQCTLFDVGGVEIHSNLNALNTVQKIKAMSKMSKIDQIHLRAVMLCMSETSKMGKEHTHILARNFLNT